MNISGPTIEAIRAESAPVKPKLRLNSGRLSASFSERAHMPSIRVGRLMVRSIE